ncbi:MULTISPECIES: hypothetical protein [Bacillaceae]|uniref:WYL domain-containing protein n=1 Tax=Evansella alkalicola TaxID=745819 RepID=A0ABS6JPN9_9BACI|nr:MULTISPECIES: hypothetical protein [Bacillaceae]MBU9720531.1 hypothetical protein [Bacillus alkalicola]
MEGILRRAIQMKRPVIIMYQSNKGIVTKRMVSVEKYDEKWLGGFCHLRKGYRKFNRENILALFPVMDTELNAYSIN